MGISRSSYYYKAKEDSRYITDEKLRNMIEKVQEEFPGYGYRRLYHHFLREGHRINSKRIKRVMREFNLYSCLGY